MRALTVALHERCLADPVLQHPFSHPGQHPEHLARLEAYLAEAMGGPPLYSETMGDRSHMLRLHAGEGDTAEMGRRFLSCFLQAMDDAGLPRDPALRGALETAMAAAVVEVTAYDASKDLVPADLPVPRWAAPDDPGA